MHSRYGSRAARAALAVLLATSLFAALPRPAQAQGRLEASYTISVARIPIGKVTAQADIGDARYDMSISGRASGLMRVVASGEGSLSANGAVADGRPTPAEFVARTTTDDVALDVKLTIEDGNVATLAASEPPASPDRIEVTEAHRKGIVDPLTALLIPVGANGDRLDDAACQRTLPIFDGRRRFDLKLAFKRMDKGKADKGYAGPIVVCAVTLMPIAGYRPSSKVVQFLTGGRQIELALAPVAGAGLLAPFRVTVANMLGNLVVQATRFEVVAPGSQRADANAGPAQ
jgi:hypothetical protein